ncbi:epoxide hydrolase 4-like [Phlebotomus argentipes]|uniref:epoxide hydrolase 4-like n=1 Tax=Phlebotomus argentipes TaxID=94469 RepID=UPI0028931847|nr:epoxide hydrolase 4-like [Phlebotomus argentipes]
MRFQQSDESDYGAVEVVPKWDILLCCTGGAFLGVWVMVKWLIHYLWTVVNPRAVPPRSHSAPEKPPSYLVDSNFGRHSYVKLSRTKFHYVEAGNATDPVIFLLHGFPDCWIGWREQIKELSRFFRVIALDLKGFNDSDKPLWRSEYRIEKVCRELVDFIHSFNVNSVTLMGHDLGGMLGWILAHTNPRVVNRLICVSAPHPNLIWRNLVSSKVPINSAWLKFIQLPCLPEIEHVRPDSGFLERNFTHVDNTRSKSKYNNLQPLNGSANEKGHILDAYKYIFSRNEDWNGPLNYYRNLPFYRIREGSLVSCPCLIVTGNSDPLFRLESVIKSTDFCENFVVKIIEGAAHWPHQETPLEFNRIVLKFLVGSRASQTLEKPEKVNNKGLVGFMLGAVSNSVNKIHNSVQMRATEAF